MQTNLLNHIIKIVLEFIFGLLLWKPVLTQINENHEKT